MISKRKIALAISCFSLLVYAKELGKYNGSSAILRPILFRSEFVSRGTLRSLQGYSQQAGYTMFGYPEFGDAVITRNLSFWETKLAQTPYYARFLNKTYRQYVIDHPEIFSEETVRAYIQGECWKNPKLIDGMELRWHHGKDGYELIPFDKHKRPHVGGNKVWGNKYAEASKRIANREIILTAQRWGKFVALDLALSTVGMMASGEKSMSPYIVNATASATAGCIAWGIESLIIGAYPLTQGSTPIFIGGCMVNIGGPASWIASGVFLVSKFAIMAGWNSYKRHIAIEIENQCRIGEKKVRFAMLKNNAKRNSVKLFALAEHL